MPGLSSLVSDIVESFLPMEAKAEEEEEGKGEEENTEEPQEEEEEEEEEEDDDDEEPEDQMPQIQADCAETTQCIGAKHHFEHCVERINSGDLKFENEDCVEEFFHLQHCVNDCAAPKIFAVLK